MYVRNVQLACIPFSTVLFAMLAASSVPRWYVIVSGVALAFAVLNACWLTLKISRASPE